MTHSNLNQPLTDLLKNAGADLVGFADLTPLPEDVRAGLPFGIAIGSRLDADIVRSLADGPSLEYAAEYDRVNENLELLANTAVVHLEQNGFRAEAAVSTMTKEELEEAGLSTPLPHKTVARLAGLGWIGKCALLVTPEFGSAVRLISVMTDAPLEPGVPIDESRCGNCRRCVLACPVSAPTGEIWTPESTRADIYDVYACYKEAIRASAAVGIPEETVICGRCIAACPYTRRGLPSKTAPAKPNSPNQ